MILHPEIRSISDELEIDAAGQRLTRWGMDVYLTKAQFRVFARLVRKQGYFVETHKLIFAAVGWRDVLNPYLQTRVVICALRKKMKPIGLKILNRYGAYVLEMAREPLGEYSPHAVYKWESEQYKRGQPKESTAKGQTTKRQITKLHTDNQLPRRGSQECVEESFGSLYSVFRGPIKKENWYSL